MQCEEMVANEYGSEHVVCKQLLTAPLFIKTADPHLFTVNLFPMKPTLLAKSQISGARHATGATQVQQGQFCILDKLAKFTPNTGGTKSTMLISQSWSSQSPTHMTTNLNKIMLEPEC